MEQPLSDTAVERPDPQVAAVFAEICLALGCVDVPQPFRELADRPAALRAQWEGFRSTVLGGQLPRVVKDMLGALIAQASGAAGGAALLRELRTDGLSEEVLGLLLDESARCPLPERYQDILRFGLLAAADGAQVGPDWVERLRQHQLDNAEISEVADTALFFTGLLRELAAGGPPI